LSSREDLWITSLTNYFFDHPVTPSHIEKALLVALVPLFARKDIIVYVHFYYDYRMPFNHAGDCSSDLLPDIIL
jgi:hypothetical protein